MFGISVSGIKNSQKHIDVTSNNIANTNSYGFKKSRAEFADVYANSVFANSKTASGMGVYNSVVSQQFTQGTLSGDTGNPLDMAIQGNGFFVLKGAPGDSNAATYTRNGAFQVNSEGYIVTAQGDYLQGWQVNDDGTTQSLDLNATSAIQLPADTGAPKMSTSVTIGVNLPADKDAVESAIPNTDPWSAAGNAFDPDVIANAQYGVWRNENGEVAADQDNHDATDFQQFYTNFDPTDSSTYTASTSQTIHDSLGGSHTLTYYMLKMGADAENSNSTVWTVIPYVDGQPVDVATQNGENPVCISVPSSSKSSVAGANFFGFKMVFDSSGNQSSVTPGKVELVNFGTNDTANTALTNSLRHQLFGYSGNTADTSKLDAKIIDATFENNPDTGKAALYSNADGSLHNAMGTSVDPHQSLSIAMDATQYGSSNFSVTVAPTDDGYSTGILTSMSVDENGIIMCEFSNGQTQKIAKVAMADFTNQQGLTKVGDTQWKESNSSGQAIAKEANTGSAGSIAGSNLELSNVDLTNELVELITAQRNYQANAQALSTQNTVMDSILNIR